MKFAKYIVTETWRVIRFLATGRTMSRKQQAARAYYLARLHAGPGDD